MIFGLYNGPSCLDKVLLFFTFYKRLLQNIWINVLQTIFFGTYIISLVVWMQKQTFFPFPLVPYIPHCSGTAKTPTIFVCTSFTELLFILPSDHHYRQTLIPLNTQCYPHTCPILQKSKSITNHPLSATRPLGTRQNNEPPAARSQFRQAAADMVRDDTGLWHT